MTMIVNINEKNYRKHLLFKNTILRDVRFRSQPGDSILVVGSSGCGKSTLVRAMLKETHFQGNINVDATSIGYVSQQDVLDCRETVYNSVYYTARLHNPDMPENKVHELVKNTLKDLALLPVMDQKIKTLSGGQKKRTQVAQQLLRNSELLLFDEADTGLDAVTTYYLMKNVTESAKKNKNIALCISHNILPENIKLFSHILVLAKGANKVASIAYFGKTADVYRYFNEDTMLKILFKILPPEEGGSGMGQKYINRYKEMTKNHIKG